MAYKIKINNRQGTFYSKKFKRKAEAKKVIMENKKADSHINQSGLRKASTGKLIRIKNKYKLMKC